MSKPFAVIITDCRNRGQPLSAVVGYHSTDETSPEETDMKLFAVRLADGNLLANDKGQVIYFDDKKEAKHSRDKYADAVVVLGPDHNRYTN